LNDKRTNGYERNTSDNGRDIRKGKRFKLLSCQFLAHLNGVQWVAGSNPVVPTIFPNKKWQVRN